MRGLVIKSSRQAAYLSAGLVVITAGVLLGAEPTAAPAQIRRYTAPQWSSRWDQRLVANRAGRVSHSGWEKRSSHFAVFSTHGPEEAAWTAQQLERAWADFGNLADQWTKTHRRPVSSLGAVSVLVVDRPHFSSVRPNGPNRFDGSPDLCFSLADGPLDARTAQLRTEACRAFLRQTQQDQVLPEWVQTGLIAYVSGEEPPWGEVTRMDLPPRSSQAAFRGRPHPADDPRVSVLWVRYLIEGRDACHAPEFFAALAAMVAQQPRSSQSFTFHRTEPFTAADRSGSRTSPVDALVEAVARSEDIAPWLHDPDLGQPVLMPESGDREDPRYRELALILKLQRRFPPQATQKSGLKVQEFGREAPQRSAEKPQQATPVALQLYYRLTDPQLAVWATIDVDGRLLFSHDRRRLKSVLDNPDRTYTTVRRADGIEVLHAAYANGDVLEAWLEENPGSPERPLVRVRRANRVPAAPTADRTAAGVWHANPSL